MSAGRGATGATEEISVSDPDARPDADDELVFDREPLPDHVSDPDPDPDPVSDLVSDPYPEPSSSPLSAPLSHLVPHPVSDPDLVSPPTLIARSASLRGRSSSSI